jgi:hypothetical protein
MLISESHLRSIIFKSLLLEGFIDDQRFLIEKYPQAQAALLQLQPVWIDWLASRFGVNATITDIHPFNEVIESVASFAKVFDSVAAKWKSNEEFRKNVEEFLSNRAWKKLDITPQIIPLLTSDEMETLKGLATREKQHFKINVSEEEMESDRVGKVGSWNLWMPTTRERSCKIAGYDPVTLKPKTTWCTARMAGSNLFYSYIGSTEENVTLFYIIKDNPVQDNDWLSVGFVDGEPDLEGGDGDKSVNRGNEGLTKAKLKSILGQDYAQIMIALTKKNKSLGGVHPARKSIEAAAKSVEALRALIVGLSKSESIDLIIAVLNEPEISAEVLSKLAQNNDENVRSKIADNLRTPAAVLSSYAKDTDSDLRSGVALNPNTPAPILMDLASDENELVRCSVAQNPRTPAPILIDLASDENETVRAITAQNRSTPASAFIDLAGDKVIEVIQSVASNSMAPTDVLTTLAGNANNSVRHYVATNPQTPTTVLTTLASDVEIPVRLGVATNPHTSTADLTTLASDADLDIRLCVASNPQTPPAILLAFSESTNEKIRQAVTHNPQAPPAILLTLAGDAYLEVRRGVASNRQTPPTILLTLAGDADFYVLWAVTQNLKTPIEALQIIKNNKNSQLSSLAKKALAQRKQEASRRADLAELVADLHSADRRTRHGVGSERERLLGQLPRIVYDVNERLLRQLVMQML